MSRKRDKTKEQKAELARQLGVKVSDLDKGSDELRAQERVCSPTLKASLDVQRAGLGLLRRPGPLALHLALYLVDKSGARLVRQQVLTGSAKKVPGPASLGPVDTGFEDERVRYARPAHFLLLAMATEGASDAEVNAHAVAFAFAASKRLTLELASESATEARPLDDRTFAARFEEPRSVRLLLDGAPLFSPASVAAVVSLPGVHRTREQLELELASPNTRLHGTVSVDLRL